jgi:hypothetical protein
LTWFTSPVADGASPPGRPLLDLDDPTRAADLDGILAEDQLRLVIHPEP